MIDGTKIWCRLYLGSMFDAQRLAKANPFGISAVISLSETGPCNTRREINYVHLHVEDTQPILVRQFDAIMHAIAENIRRGKVLVHCGSGISRAPVMTLWWTTVAERLGFEEGEALSLGKLAAGLTAQSKGQRLGIYKPLPQEGKKTRARERGEEFLVEICGRQAPAINTTDGVRAVIKNQPIEAKS